MKNSNQNVKLLIVLSSSAMLTLMSMATICSIIISFFTSSLHGTQFTWEGRAQLQKAKKERDPDCVKLEHFYV